MIVVLSFVAFLFLCFSAALAAQLVFLHLEHRGVRPRGQKRQRRPEAATAIPDLDRLRDGGNIGAGDLCPLRQKARLGETTGFRSAPDLARQQAVGPFEAFCTGAS